MLVHVEGVYRAKCSSCGLTTETRTPSPGKKCRKPSPQKGGGPAASRTSPFREALRALCGGAEPPDYVRGDGTPGLTDREMDDLQGWASSHATVRWMMGIHVVEAAESIVLAAYADGSLKDEREEAVREIMEA